VARPAYNTGTGFFVANGKLYDANGVEFKIRGVNRLHWDFDSSGLPNSRANTERINVDLTRASADNVALMKSIVAQKIVPMPGSWDATCDESTSALSAIVDKWVAQASAWRALDRWMILNIANEWGPSNSTVWRDSYITAIKRLRAAGYTGAISVTAGGCGQDSADLLQYAQAVFDSDPQKNVIFDLHVYGNFANNPSQSWQKDLTSTLAALAKLGLPLVIGEFGPGRNIGPSPTSLTPGQIIQGAEANGIGWLAWAWDDNPSDGDSWFSLTFNSAVYNSSSDLTAFGKEVIENATYGLKVLAKPATIFP
jgi:mannan endo-1,4-beta-mannosidase